MAQSQRALASLSEGTEEIRFESYEMPNLKIKIKDNK